MRRLTVVIAVLLLAAVAAQPAPAADGWDWSLNLEAGLGTTIVNHLNFSVALGARLGQFPAEVPILGGHEFGADFANVGGHWAAGPWLRLIDNVSIVIYLWQDNDRATGDVALRYTAPFRW